MNTYTGDGNHFARLSAFNMYDDKGAVCELVSNYYDDDATVVNIKFEYADLNDISGQSVISKIVISGDCTGMVKTKLNNLSRIGYSEKNGSLTPVYKRKMLGSFGLGLASFQRLGQTLHIFSKTKENGELYMKISVSGSAEAIFSEIQLADTPMVNYETGVTLIIADCNIRKDVFFEEKESRTSLSHKLSYLPIYNLFRIFIGNDEVKRICRGNLIQNPKGNFITYGDYKLPIKLFFESNPKCTMSHQYRGIHFVIHNRIIEYDLFDEVKDMIPSPSSIASRIIVYIYADELFNQLNISRNGLNDETVVRDIAKTVGTYIRQIRHLLYVEGKNPKGRNNSSTTLVDETIIENWLINKEEIRKQRIDDVMLRINSEIKILKDKGIKFCYRPKNENEVALLVSELCGKDLLPFQIKEYDGRASIDMIVENCNVLKHMELEHDLNNFFDHEHPLLDVEMICCWSFDKRRFKGTLNRYRIYPPSIIQTIQVKQVKNWIKNGKNHQYELVYTYEGVERIIEVICISKIITDSIEATEM